MECMILPVRLSNAEFQFAFTNGIDVVNRTTSGFYGAAYAMVFTALVDQTANRATSWIINACYTTGTDGDEFFSKCSW